MAMKVGHAGTEVTFFDWPNAGPARPGTGTVAAIGLRVPGEALDYWVRRFEMIGVPHEGIVERAGRRSLAFTDPERQRFVLTDDEGVPGGTPWPKSPVPGEMAIRGLGPMTLAVRRARPRSWC